MKSLFSTLAICGVALSASLFTGSAFAQDTATMTVTANVAPSCQLTNVDALAFGQLDQTADNDAQADITWVCTNGYDSEIQLDGGGSGSILLRSMSGPGALAYQLYTDAARSIIFGDGGLGDVVNVSGTGYGNPATVTVYGRVPQADAAAADPGNYIDTINVTILF